MKGFTLIELLAVLAVIGIVGLITTVSGVSILNVNKEKLYNEQIANIEKAAKNYQIETGTEENITLEELAGKGYLDSSDLKNPKTNEKLCGYVSVSFTENQYYFNFIESKC